MPGRGVSMSGAGDDRSVVAGSIRRLAVRASAWTTVSYAYGEGTRLVSSLVIAFLLARADNIAALGLIAYANILTRGLQMLSDVGLNMSVVQHARGEDEAFLRTAWSVQAIRGVVMWVLCVGLAWPWAWFFGEPSLVLVVPVVGFSVVLAGFASPGALLAERKLRGGLLAALEMVPQTAAVLVMLVWASIEATVWALASATVVRMLVRMVLSHALAPPSGFRFVFDREALGSILRFGAWIFLSTALTFGTMELPALTIGKAFDAETLAIFSLALMYAMLPSQAVVRLARQALFPALSAVVNRGGDLGGALARVQGPLRTFGGFASAALFASGPWFVLAVYPDKLWDASWMLLGLAWVPLLRILSECSRSPLLARGNARATAIGQGLKLVSLGVLLPLGIWRFGLHGAVAAAVASEAVQYVAYAVQAERQGLRTLRGDALALFGAVLAGVAGLAASVWVWSVGGPALGLEGRVLAGVALLGGLVVPAAVYARGAWRSVRAVRGAGNGSEVERMGGSG
ncbi:MAG: oligosaccharide flippase family protein [Planctomycetota bacterium]